MARYNLKPTFLIAALLCAIVANVRAQQADATKFDQLTYETAAAKAQADCLALWADHAFDPLRDKVALGVNPTAPMLANRERLSARDKPVMDLVIKTLQRCRTAYAPAVALLPPGAKEMIEGLLLKQDALIAELNSGKITFGDYNTALSGIREALSLVPQSTQVASTAAEAEQSAKVSEPVTPSPAIANVRAQQSDGTTSDQTYETALAKAQADCAVIWADHALDLLRDKVPLGIDKPTLAMLTNRARLRASDKPVADLALKALDRCREAYEPFLAFLPPAIKPILRGVQLREDALNAELYSGKITFGTYNVSMNRLSGEFAQALSDARSPQVSPAPVVTKANEVTSSAQTTAGARIALVIGDSNYSNLPKLVNPENDARSIAELLQKIGFTTKLVTDASETDLRREVRKFAKDSANADLAFVFYAGHGAQVSGENYVLPIDMAIPETEADIQFAGLKVDDLVNSIRARTKIVFLDACRDNPALFANLVKGRGSYPKGLAPAVGSNFEQANPGGGVFIAYATDSGSIALDGKGGHSPFTQALLRNLDKPISIDDMFSLVTKEVRLVTKNAQRPYKYASLENIVCLTGRCSASTAAVDTDAIQQAEHSESNDLQIALQTNNVAALESYLQSYPDSSKRKDVLNTIARLQRAEFNEWTLFGVAVSPRTLTYMKLSSVRPIGTRVAVREKVVLDPTQPNKDFPNAAYLDEISVYDCTGPRRVVAEADHINKAGENIYHYKWGDPKYVDFSIGITIQPGSVGDNGRKILCNDELNFPLVSKQRLAKMDFSSLASTADGQGEIFYELAPNAKKIEGQKELVVILKMNKDMQATGENKDLPPYRFQASRVSMSCGLKQLSYTKNEYYDLSFELVFMIAPEPVWTPFVDKSLFDNLQKIVCNTDEVQQ